MPAPRDPNAPPSKNRRRRPEVMPGGWLLLVLLIMIVLALMFFVNTFASSSIDYSEVRKLAEAGKPVGGGNNLVIKRVNFIGADRLEGELSKDWRDYVGGDKTINPLDKERL